MRLQEKRSFKAINFDDADEFLEDGDTRGMLNVRVGYSESGDDGIVENVKGTVSLFSQLNFTLPIGTNKCIGTCTDEQNNRLIWFNYNSNSNHAIYCYNNDSNTIQTILASATLNFQGTLIHSIDILNNILAWTDNFNRPRSIDVVLALAGTYAGATIEELINDAKLVPMIPPVCTVKVTNGTAYIQSLKSFQFIYRYVFIGGEKGAWSTVSKLVATAYKNQKINKITLDVSGSEIFTKTAMRPVITYIEFASRELYTFNFNQFKRILTADLVAAAGLVDYFDTESKTPVDVAETNTAFYENPIKAGTVAFQNNRKFYADCTEGYNAFPLALVLSNVNTQVIPQVGGIPYLSDCSTHGSERYLKPDSKYNYSIAWYDKYGRKSGALELPALTIATQPQTSNDYKANVLNFGVNLAAAGTYPSYAEKIEILRSDNQTVTWFAQGRINNVLYCTGYDANNLPVYIKPTAGVGNLNVSDGGAIEVHIDISNWLKYKTNIGYTFTEGDRVSFFTMGGTGLTDTAAPSSLRNLKVKSLRGSLLIVDYNTIGRNTLRDEATAKNSYGFNTYSITRFIVGDNGIFFYSKKSAASSYANIPTAFDNLAKVPAINFSTTNNLYGIGLVYGDVGSTSTSVNIYIVGANGYFAKGAYNAQTDTWTTFSVIPTGITEDINSIESNFNHHNNASVTDIAMVCNSGKILSYNIASGIVTTQASGVTTNLRSIVKGNYIMSAGIEIATTRIAVGDNGVILCSNQDGIIGDPWTPWTPRTLNPAICQSLRSVYLNGIYGCIVGDEGVMLTSQDTGTTWTRRTIATKSNLYSVDGEGSVLAPNRAYIAGEAGYLGLVDMSTGQFIQSYATGTTRTIYRMFSYSLSNFDLGYLLGESDLLIDAEFLGGTFADYSANAAALFGSSYLNYAAKIELFSPKTSSGPVIFYEVGDAFKVGQNYSFSKGKGDDGDVYLIKKDFQGNTSTPANPTTAWSYPGEFVFSMTPDSNNTAGVWDKDFGRPNTVLLYPELQQRRNILRYSDRYVQDSKINGLSNFQDVNYGLIPNEFGFVRKITPLETVMVINAERETATAHIDQTMFTQSNGQQVAAISNMVINNVRKLAGGFGCTNPESVISYLGQLYWYSSNKSAVCRYNNSNGIFPISEYKARTYFYSLINAGLIIGGFEPKFKNYLMTMDGFTDGATVVPATNTGTGFDDFVYVIAIQSDGKIIAVGNFTTYNGTGINRVVRININGTLDTTFNVGTGANIQVLSSAIQSDGKIIIGGDFTTYNGTSSNFIARLNADGTLDTTFNVGTGANNSVLSIAIQSDGKIIVGGNFTSYNGTAINRIARLNTNGTLDAIFNIGGGYNGSVLSIAIQSDGKILTGGNFNSFNISTRNNILRLNADGTLDTTFNVGTGANSNVQSVILTNGKIVIVGGFTTYNGTSSNFIARLNADGTLDTTFNVGTGANGYIYTAAIQSDGKIIAVGNFTTYNGTGINRVVRININGTLDTTFNVGTGANNPIYSIGLQAAGKVVIGGVFITYNGVSANKIISLNSDGSINTAATTVLAKQTMAFQEGSNKWISKYSFIPEKYGQVKVNMFSFYGGELWKHDASSAYNNFYGVQYTSQVNPVFNKEPNSQKNFLSISLEADKVWGLPAMTTPEGQKSFILSGHFEQINKEWWADVKQDINTPNRANQDDALINGDFMQSNVLNVMMESTLSGPVKLRFANLYTATNERTNK